MLGRKIAKLLKDPFGVTRRNLNTLLRKRKYQYTYANNSEPYWQSRLSEYNLDLRGVGNWVMSAEQNRQMYAQAKDVFLLLCQTERIAFNSVKMLDIGCGTGFYAQIFLEEGGKDYTGIDITDALFAHLKRQFPTFKFLKMDVTKQQIEGVFDLIIMIDVTQHITDERRFSAAMQNVRSHLSENGVFIVTSWLNDSARRSYYEVSRSINAYTCEFRDWIFGKPLPFRGKFIFSVKRKSKNKQGL